MANIFMALDALRPKAKWTYHSKEGEISPVYGNLLWQDDVQTQPTEDEINAWISNYVPPVSLADQVAALQKQVADLLAAQTK